MQIPFTVLKTPPPAPLSRLSSCTVFTSSAVAGLLRRRREGPVRMSAQFIKIPLVSSQCWHAHMLRFNPPKSFFPAEYGTHVTSHSHSPRGACALPCKLTLTYCTSPFQSPQNVSPNWDHQQMLQYDSPGGPLQTCFIIWSAVSIVSASFDEFTSNRYYASVFLLAEDNCWHSDGPGP